MNAPVDRARRPVEATLDDVARIAGGRVEGDGAETVSGLAPVDEAEAGQLGFLALRRYVRHVADSRARAFLVASELRHTVTDGRPCIVVDEPYAALRAVLAWMHPAPAPEPGVHRTAVVGRGVRIGEGAQVGPYAVLEEGAHIGAHAVIGAHCVVGGGATVGERTRLHPHVVVYPGCVIGADVTLHSGARIGADGFGYTFVDGAHLKIPQVGRAVIEDGVEIGANSTVDRGSLGDTVVGRGTKIDNLVQVAHNVRIGALSLLAALVGVAGSTRLGRRTWVGGQAGIINQLEIGDDARIAVTSAVFRDVPAGETVSGNPARPHRDQLRRQAQASRVPRLAERIARLEERVARMGEGP